MIKITSIKEIEDQIKTIQQVMFHTQAQLPKSCDTTVSINNVEINTFKHYCDSKDLQVQHPSLEEENKLMVYCAYDWGGIIIKSELVDIIVSYEPIKK